MKVPYIIHIAYPDWKRPFASLDKNFANIDYLDDVLALKIAEFIYGQYEEWNGSWNGEWIEGEDYYENSYMEMEPISVYYFMNGWKEWFIEENIDKVFKAYCSLSSKPDNMV